MSELTIQETFTIGGVLTDVTSVKLSNAASTFGVKRDDTDAVVVVDGASMTKTATGTYEYSFTEPDSDLTYTYWVEWVYQGATYRDEHTVAGRTTGLATVRVTDKYLDWLQNEFKPLTLATPVATQKQCLENAIRYWNTHSAYKIMTMVAYTSGQVRAQLPESVKMVVQVYPSSTTTWIWNDHPLWAILGVTILDNITSDMIMLSQAFRNYRIFVGADFRWAFEKSEEPNSEGGYIYAMNVPSQVAGLCCVCTKRITDTEDIKQEPILDWVLQYTKALLMMIEGNTLRKSTIVDIKNDGGDLVSEGNTEKIRLQEKLAKDSRWVVLARRC